MSQFDPTRPPHPPTAPQPPSPYPAPPAQQPPTAVYGQPMYGQPVYGQPVHGQPVYGNSSGQAVPTAAYGQPQQGGYAPAPTYPSAVPLQNPGWQAPQPPTATYTAAPTAIPTAPNTTVPIAPQPAPIPQAPAPQAPRPLRPQPIGAQPTSPAPVSATPAQPVAAAPTQPVATAPVPAKARPVLVTKSAEDLARPKVDATANEAPEDTTDRAVKAAPPWLVSLVVHMVLLIVFALIAIPLHIKNQVELEVVYAETLGQQVLDDTLQSPESLNMDIEVPALSFDKKLVDDPFAAPPMIDIISLDATKASSQMVDAPSIGLALSGREAGAKKALLAAYGGNATTEAAVRSGLEWLKRNQQKDGTWSLVGPYADGGHTENLVSATAMALLAFQGAGHTHQAGDFKREVANGWKALLKMQNADGFFVTDANPHQNLYAQAQATIALCEIYGMTKDPDFKQPAQNALKFALFAQAREGGWRYTPKVDSDTSVTGWYVMALQSGLMAGLEVDSPSLDNIMRFLDSVAAEGGSRYRYQPGREPTPTMTAEGLLCRQYLGWKHDDPRMLAGMEYVLANPIDYNHPEGENVYYWYYATQAAHHMDGDHWNRWNAVMRQVVPSNQIKTGAEKGSWARGSNTWNAHGGRLYVTCLSIYMLEVYYRHLPIYKYRLE